jgi:hypothetical protein
MHFSALHARDLTTGTTNHPNQWYLESRNMLGNQENANGPGGIKIKTTHVAVFNKDKPNVEKTGKDAFMDDLMDDSELLSALDSMPVGNK